MAFLEDLLAGLSAPQSRGEDCVLQRVTDALIEPVSLDEIKEHLKLDGTEYDADLTRLAKACRIHIEEVMEQAILQQTWNQVQSRVGQMVRLRRGPVLAITEVAVIPNFDADTETIVASTTYTNTGNFVVARSSWPSHRGFRSFRTKFTCGWVAPAITPPALTPTDVQLLAAQASVPSDFKLAILNMTGHYFENREGQAPESRYEATFKATFKASGLIPGNVLEILQPYISMRMV